MSVDGHRLNLYRAGSGEPLVLLHGIGLSLRTWRPVLPALERSHDVVALDLPGFAGSPRLAGGVASTVPSLADAVERVIHDLSLESPHVAGNSLGGWIALELARRGRVRSVVGLSPAGMWTLREIVYAKRNLDMQRTVARIVAPHAEALTQTAAGRTALMWAAMSRPWRIQPGEAAYLIRNVAAAPGWRETLDWTSPRRAEGLEQIRCPVLIAWGTRDTVLLPRQGPRFVRRIPNAKLRLLSGLGHIPMSDDPELVARTILDFTAIADGAKGRRRPPAPSQAAGRLSPDFD